MKIYIVSIKYKGDYEDDYIDKIFLKREDAEQYTKDWIPYEYSIDEYDVEE